MEWLWLLSSLLLFGVVVAGLGLSWRRMVYPVQLQEGTAERTSFFRELAASCGLQLSSGLRRDTATLFGRLASMQMRVKLAYDGVILQAKVQIHALPYPGRIFQLFQEYLSEYSEQPSFQAHLKQFSLEVDESVWNAWNVEFDEKQIALSSLRGFESSFLLAQQLKYLNQWFAMCADQRTRELLTQQCLALLESTKSAHEFAYTLLMTGAACGPYLRALDEEEEAHCAKLCMQRLQQSESLGQMLWWVSLFAQRFPTRELEECWQCVFASEAAHRIVVRDPWSGVEQLSYLLATVRLQWTFPECMWPRFGPVDRWPMPFQGEALLPKLYEAMSWGLQQDALRTWWSQQFCNMDAANLGKLPLAALEEWVGAISLLCLVEDALQTPVEALFLSCIQELFERVHRDVQRNGVVMLAWGVWALGEKMIPDAAPLWKRILQCWFEWVQMEGIRFQYQLALVMLARECAEALGGCAQDGQTIALLRQLQAHEWMRWEKSTLDLAMFQVGNRLSVEKAGGLTLMEDNREGAMSISDTSGRLSF